MTGKGKRGLKRHNGDGESHTGVKRQRSGTMPLSHVRGKAQRGRGGVAHNDRAKLPRKDEQSKTKSAAKNMDSVDGGEAEHSEAKPAKVLRKERKLARTHGDLIGQANKMANMARAKDVAPEQRAELIASLMEMLVGRVNEIAMRHDAARAVQVCVQYGTPEQRAQIFTELEPHLLVLMKQTYSKFLVKKLLKYGTAAQRQAILDSMAGQVPKLLRHREAAVVVESLYNDWANAVQRHRMMIEFYAPELTVFKESQAATLAQLVVAHPDKKAHYLAQLAKHIQACMDKETVSHSLVHSLLAEYMSVADEAAKTDMASLAAPHLLSILHTRDGMWATLSCLWHSSAKDRKVFIKSLKGVVSKIAKEEHGHVVLLCLFDIVDDTVLLKKSVLNELITDMAPLLSDKFGRLVFLYLLSPRDPRYFGPSVIGLLQQGDANPWSKKPANVRHEELRKAIGPSLLQHIKANFDQLITQGPLSQLVETTIFSLTGQADDIITALIDAAKGPTALAIQHPIAGLLTKRLIAKNVCLADGRHIAQEVWANAQSHASEHVLTKQGCYTLAAIFSSECPADTKAQAKTVLSKLSLPSEDAQDTRGKALPGAVLAKAMAHAGKETEA